MDIINKTCAEIESAVGFEYKIQLKHTHTDCEQSWYSEDGSLLADPSDSGTLIAPVISVSSDRLVTSHCVDELRHEIICDTSGFRFETLFRVRNETAATSNSADFGIAQWWIYAFFITMIVLLLLMCFMLRKKIFSCVSRAVARIFLCDDSENRRVNQTQSKKDWEDPESAVQMKLRSDAPGSLNQSESEQLNDSLSKG